MKKCTNCAKDLPDAALHCVFCGGKQPAAPAQGSGAGAQAKTVMGWQASDLLKDMQNKGVQQPPPAAAPPPMAPPPAPSHSPAASAATMFVQGPVIPQPQQPAGPPPQQPPPPMGGGHNPHAIAATLVPTGPAPMGGANPAASAATMFVQGPVIPQPGPPQQQQPMGGYGGPPPQQQPPPYQQQPPPYQQQQPQQPYGQPQQPYGQPQQPYGQPQMGGHMGGPSMGGPMGGYNPVPVQQPMNPPYLASQTAARVGAPVEPYKDSIKIILIAFGAALLAVFAVPMGLDPMGFRWDLLSDDKLDALAKFNHVYFAAAGLLALVFGAVPLATVPRGALAAVLGLVPIVLVVVNHLRGPKIDWQFLAFTLAVIALVPGLLLRSEYRSQMLPRILTTVGAVCILLLFLVPKDGGDPLLMASIDKIGAVEGKLKVSAILKLLPFVIAVLSLLVWLPPPTTAGAKIIAWLFILMLVIVGYADLLITGHIGDQLKTGFNAKLLEPWGVAAFAAFIGYGVATVVGKSLEHS